MDGPEHNLGAPRKSVKIAVKQRLVWFWKTLDFEILFAEHTEADSRPSLFVFLGYYIFIDTIITLIV